jgi:hypothetical protein
MGLCRQIAPSVASHRDFSTWACQATDDSAANVALSKIYEGEQTYRLKYAFQNNNVCGGCAYRNYSRINYLSVTEIKTNHEV